MGRGTFFILIVLAVFQLHAAVPFSAECVGENKKNKQIEQHQDGKVQNPDKWFAQDKAKHFLAGTFSTIFIHEVSNDVYNMKKSEAAAYAVSISAIISVSKEIFDARSPENHFCKKDLVWDGLGILAGLMIVQQR